MYRSYHKFKADDFVEDVSQTMSNNITNTNDFVHINNQRSAFDSCFGGVLNKHAPLKQKTIRKPPCPFMNGDLRKAIYNKCLLRNKYYKNRTTENWSAYKKQRNLVVKLRKKSIRIYFNNKCNSGNKNDFWSVMKPFYSSKFKTGNDNLILRVDETLITDPSDVCESFNKFFTSAATNIGFADNIPLNALGDIDIVEIFKKHETHSSILRIKDSHPVSNVFEFTYVTQTYVANIVCKLNEKKSMGYDRIPARLIKICATELCPFITEIVNRSIKDNYFPTDLKLAEVCAIFKKHDRLLSENYRPVSLLRILSKVFERVYTDQITAYFDKIFTPFLSAYRKGFGCHDLLLRLIEQWKDYLDDNLYVGALLIDLSKAFDCLPHQLLVCKLRAYGFTEGSCKLMSSYLSGRKQRVKIGEHRSSWQNLEKGVPQGSITGPILFNIFIHDLFYFIQHAVLFNYADDDTLLYANSDLELLKRHLIADGEIAVDWFHMNGMKANPNKFQLILSHRYENPSFSINIAGHDIVSQTSVVLLGVEIDCKLTFYDHVNKLCKNASKQVNILRRIGALLGVKQKIDIYRTYILSNFNYCPLVWHYCPRSCVRLMEKVNERALRFVFDDQNSSYTDLLKKTNRESRLSFRNKAIVTQVYKSIYHISPPYLCTMFKRKINPYNLRNDFLLVQPKVTTTTYGLLSIKYHGSKMWNMLPEFVKESRSLSIFKKNVKNIKEPLCSCSFCSMIF